MSKLPEYLGPVDTAFLHAERPEAPMNIGALAIFEGKIPFEVIYKLIDVRIHQTPVYQRKLLFAPLNLGQPRWAFDPDFYIGRHVFRIRLDPPGSDEQLRNLAGRLISKMLDRSRPLWEMYVIEGLSGDRTGVLFKIHHCMVDGLSAVELVTLLLDLSPQTPRYTRKPLYDVPRLPSGVRALTETIQKELPFKLGMLQKLGMDIGYIGQIIGDKEKRRGALVGVANLVNDNLRPIRRLPINGRNSGKQSIAWSEFSLAEVRAIKSGRKVSVNEVMLSIFGAAIDAYVRGHGDPGSQAGGQNFVRVLVPVNMRLEEEKGDYGNRISVLPVDLPFGIKDPLNHMQAVADYSQAMKESSLSVGLDIVLTLPALAPAPLQPLIWGLAPVAFALLAHTWCTNVAGPQIPVYLAGHKLLHSYGYFPLNPSMGLACVIMSYNQRITMTLIADSGIIPDITELKRLVDQSFEALRSAANVQPIEPIIVETPRREMETQPTPPPIEAAIEAAIEAEIEPVIEVVPLPEPVTMTEPSVPSANGISDDTPTVRPAEMPAEEPAAKPRPLSAVIDRPVLRPKLFSEEWAQSYQRVLNNNAAYRAASLNWEAGSLAFVVRASARDGFPQARGVVMDLHKGECRSAHSVEAEEAYREANFVIEADYATWQRVLGGKENPLFMLIRGKLSLRKGALTRLLPFTNSAQELLHSAQKV